MKLMKRVLFLFLATTLIVACNSDDDGGDITPPIAAPSNVDASIMISDDDSGTVTITPTATGATSFEVFFGDVANETPTTLTPGQVATNVYEEGTFTATIVAIGSDGQETEITREIVVEFSGGDAFDGGLLANGDFEAGAAPWTIGLGPDPAPVVTDNGNTFYSVNVDMATPDQVFLVNVSQIGLTITPDTNYILTFDAWSDVDRSIVAGIGLSGGDFSNTSVPVAISTMMETYTLQLTSTGFGDDNSRVLFDLAGELGMVNIDNVSLVEGGDGSDTPGNDDMGGAGTVMLVNGDFEAGAEPWNAGVEEFDAPPAPVVTENGNTFYSVNVENPDPTQPFLVNLSQQGLSIAADTNYILMFDAWSDRDRTIIAGIGESAGGFASVATTVDLTDQLQTFALNLTTVGFGGDDIRVLFDSNAEAGLVNIDNVSIVEGGDGSDTPGNDDMGGDTSGISFPVDHEDANLDYPWVGFGSADFGPIPAAILANPDASGINTSATVLEINKLAGAQVWAGASLPLEGAIDFSNSAVVTVKVWSPRVGTPILLKVEDSTSEADGNGNPSIFAEIAATSTVAMAWEELSFDLSQFAAFDAANSYDTVILFPDFGNPGNGELFYFDDIEQ